jgi:hypothetical protein
LKGTTLSSKQLISMHENLEKAKLIVPCHLCSEPTIAWKGHKGVSTCPNCRKVHKATLARERRRKTLVLPGALPEFGHIIRDDEGRVQCHICGRWCHLLDPHLRIHGLNSDQYREEFSLNRTQALCSPKVSEQDRQNLIKSGWAGKLKDYELSRFAESREMRLQARLSQSEVRIGIKLPSTPARIAAGKANYQKALILKNCEACGALVMTHKAHKHAYCEKCRPGHRLQQMKDWRLEHLEYKNEYFRTYRERKKRGEIKPRQPMTMTEAKVRAQKENQLLSQVKNTQYKCNLCGAIFYGRPCESQHDNHYCPECKPIARILTIKAWRNSHRESCQAADARYKERKRLANITVI